jgi:hypothetical protein
MKIHTKFQQMESLATRRAIIIAGLMLATGCASDQRVATAGKVRLSAAREPFTFSSWDVGRVEWSAAPKETHAVPPNVAVVLLDKTVVPLRLLTLDKARRTPALTVGTPARLDDGHGVVYDRVTPVTGSGFRFDFAGDRLVHFVAAPYDNAGSPSEPVFEALDVQRTDAYGDVKQYALPLSQAGCIDLFGSGEGLDTDLVLPPLLP